MPEPQTLADLKEWAEKNGFVLVPKERIKRLEIPITTDILVLEHSKLADYKDYEERIVISKMATELAKKLWEFKKLIIKRHHSKVPGCDYLSIDNFTLDVIVPKRPLELDWDSQQEP